MLSALTSLPTPFQASPSHCLYSYLPPSRYLMTVASPCERKVQLEWPCDQEDRDTHLVCPRAPVPHSISPLALPTMRGRACVRHSLSQALGCLSLDPALSKAEDRARSLDEPGAQSVPHRSLLVCTAAALEEADKYHS